MKREFKIMMAILAIGIVSIFVACNSRGESKKEETASLNTESSHEGEHTFACPMHPEEKGKEGDKCPKCGMKLEHMDPPANANTAYYMQFSTNPAAIEPGKEITLSLIPKVKGKESEQVALDIEHEKKIHLIVVSEDLSWFDHIHPEFGTDGSYTVKEKFPAPGKYTLFADYKPSGGNHALDKLEVNVAGNPVAAKIFSTDKTSATVDGFTVTLTPTGGKFITGVPMHIAGMVMQNGKEVDVNTLENYLGAKAHMVVVSLNDKEYMHVHPGVEGGKFDLHTTFEKPGIYRGWIQFQTGGKIHTADFVMNVKAGTEEDKKKATEGEHEKMEGHENH